MYIKGVGLFYERKIMLKKIFLSPFFVSAAFVVLWLSFMGVVYFGFPNDVLAITEEGAFIEIVTHLGYVILIAVLLSVSDDFSDKIKTWGVYLFLAICCLLREAGIQHHLSTTDTTPFKSRFFLNPNNPLSEKIIFGAVLLLVFGTVLYLAFKYSKHLILSFFKFNTVTWSVAVLCTVGVCAKIVDRFPSNYRKANDGVPLSDGVYALCQLLEESSEMFLPYIAVIILWQYRLQRNQ